MSSSEEDLPAETGCQRVLFAKLLKNHWVLLNKLMIPAIIHAKEKAWSEKPATNLLRLLVQELLLGNKKICQ